MDFLMAGGLSQLVTSLRAKVQAKPLAEPVVAAYEISAGQVAVFVLTMLVVTIGLHWCTHCLFQWCGPPTL
jgi:hypothetical protein